MADQTDTIANAEAPATGDPVAVAATVPVQAPAAPVPVAVEPAAKAPAAKPVPAKAPISKPAARRKPATPKKSTVVAKKAKPAAKPAAAPTTAKFSVTQLKDKIMASKTTDFTATINKSMTQAVADMQSKAQAAYDKGTGMVAEMTDLAKGNVEAVVESGKILASGVEGLSKSYAEDAKSAYETLTADIKEMAAIKSPTELFQLQGKIMRRNFDAMVAASSKSSESAMELANDVFAPVTARVNLTVEKLSKAA